jgi:ketosteroid isomerase-like protein
MFRRAEQGDRTAVYELLDEDVVWESSLSLPAGVYRGPEGVRRFFRDWIEAFEDYRAESTEFIDAGEDVIVAVRHRARGRSSGVEVEMPSFQVWTLRDGKIVRYRGFSAREEALEAVGLRE